MPHVPFTLYQLATIQAFPTSHRLALRSRIVLDPEEVEEIAELYARDPYDVAYVLAAAEDGSVEVTRWPEADWRVFANLDAALRWVIAVEEQLEREALRARVT